MTLSTAAAADAVAVVQDWLAWRRDHDKVPGIQVAVWHDGTILLSAAIGDADVGVPLTTTHRFRIVSHSKTFTAVAVLQLVESGALRLDDTIGQLLPALADTEVGRRTVRELLAHGGGLTRDSDDGDFWELRRAFPDADELAAICASPAAAVLERNERFKYSNIGFSVLGQVVAAVSGESYADYVAANIVDRLGLTHTAADLTETEVGSSDPTLVRGFSSLEYWPTRLPIAHISTGAMAAATGFVSTAVDVVRFLAANLPGDDRLLQDDSKRIMQRAEWPVAGGETQYGLGLAILDVAGHRLVGHGGGFPGHITRSVVDVEQRLAISVLTNAIDGAAQTYAHGAVHLLHLAATAEPDPVAPPGALARCTGRFASVWGVFDLVVLGGRLFQLDPSHDDPAASPIRLDYVDDDTLRFSRAPGPTSPGYASPGELLRITRRPDGTIASLRAGSSCTALPFDDFVAFIAARSAITLPD